MPDIIGRIGHHPSRPERLALLGPDGSPQVWFAWDTTRAEIKTALASGGLVLRDDDTVVRTT